MGAGGKQTLFKGAVIDNQVDFISADTKMIYQGGCLGRCAEAGDGLALGLDAVGQIFSSAPRSSMLSPKSTNVSAWSKAIFSFRAAKPATDAFSSWGVQGNQAKNR